MLAISREDFTRSIAQINIDFAKYCSKQDRKLTNLLAQGINAYAKIKSNEKHLTHSQPATIEPPKQRTAVSSE